MIDLNRDSLYTYNQLQNGQFLGEYVSVESWTFKSLKPEEHDTFKKIAEGTTMDNYELVFFFDDSVDEIREFYKHPKQPVDKEVTSLLVVQDNEEMEDRHEKNGTEDRELEHHDSGEEQNIVAIMSESRNEQNIIAETQQEVENPVFHAPPPCHCCCNYNRCLQYLHCDPSVKYDPLNPCQYFAPNTQYFQPEHHFQRQHLKRDAIYRLQFNKNVEFIESFLATV
ncbi:hypothetical protein EIN_264750 [Entamoeba invadens IP1]|uniref:Uncharacterized protein n=1 Tax=Entamoeba invadens IP1 TaxID=370355 RepID=A0A0A1U2E5_ENTIV|nr:hypothetical protein EIN_264750 [Entamoeba invadens IP1]ELP85698.1 hypothetical protein EIN_264750 [Entamoeba invadens IP1]|eukprot:XP_004185044.1 hypothetical protein EIN_264750 [Entamoeba invadens IP1]